jgi:hypothetical protein
MTVLSADSWKSEWIYWITGRTLTRGIGTFVLDLEYHATSSCGDVWEIRCIGNAD